MLAVHCLQSTGLPRTWVCANTLATHLSPHMGLHMGCGSPPVTSNPVSCNEDMFNVCAGSTESDSVQMQVMRLIQQATSHENLCQAYIGWCPFW